MIFKNGWNFGGEIVHTKDFGVGKGGNITVSGLTPSGSPMETSVFMSECLFSKVVEHINSARDKFPKINVTGHFEVRVHETAGNNIKRNLRLIADELQWA